MRRPRSKRGVSTLCVKDLVEGVRQLLIAIANQKANRLAKKSTAINVRACARMNSRHLVPTRVWAGPKWLARRILRTVVADTVMPSPLSSPTIH